MSGRLSCFLASIAAAVLLLAPVTAVNAAPGSGGGQGSGGQSGGVLTAGVTYGGGGGSGGGGDGCSWRLVDGGAAVPNMGVAEWPRVEDGITYHMWERRCPDDPFPRLFEVAETDPVDLLPDLIERLRSRELPSPEPVFQALDPTHGWAYVTVPVDFRAGGDSWRTVSVTARYGPTWATVTANPAKLSFDPGDPAGTAASCEGAAPVAGYDALAPGACSYTYTNSSSTSPYDGYHFMTSMSIDWAISWSSSSGAGGALDGWSTTTSAPLAVAEVQGVVTCTGSRSGQGDC